VATVPAPPPKEIGDYKTLHLKMKHYGIEAGGFHLPALVIDRHAHDLVQGSRRLWAPPAG
jgi:hypothetical protein